MNLLDNKIASLVMDNLTLEELEAMLEQKRKEIKFLSAPVQLTEKDKIRNYCINLLKKKFYAPTYR
jgi:hypothetical protein